MAIYRGAGGAGDAVGDSASEALLVRELAIEVQADADAAEAAKIAAIAAKVAAELAETNAETAETNAETAETNAETAASAAATSASNAASSASTATSQVSLAATSATNAAASAADALASEGACYGYVIDCQVYQGAAQSSENAAQTSAYNAYVQAQASATSATNAATSATTASTQATNAANSATAAATSATNAANSATSAASSATTATTQAGIATTQATNATASASAASTSATNASNSASAASTSATNAATSATSASNSASAASTSASNASTSEIAAAASAAAAAASYDSFDDRYLGAKSAAPTLDNDGNALIAGALYYNTGAVTPADKGMYVYDGSQWIAASASSTAILTVYKYTATSGQTIFSGNDDNALSLAYTVGSVIITLNGVVLEVPSEVTASSGTSVVLASGAATGDELNIYAFSTFDIANTYTQAQVDSFAVKLTGNQSISGVKTFSDNVGIGTSSPTEKLVVAGNSIVTGTAPTFNINGTAAATYGITVSASGTNTAVYQYSSVDGSIKIGGIQSYSFPVFWAGNAERMRLDASGNLLVGTTSQPAGTYRFVSSTNGTGANGGALFVSNQSSTGNETFSAWHTATSGNNTFCYFGTEATFTQRGSITYNRGAGLVAYNTTSDYRAKDIISTLLNSGEVIDSVPVYLGKMKGATQARPMFIAHETPDYAHTGEKDAVDEDGNPVYQQMDTSSLVPVLWAEIQSLRKRIQALENK